jgi:hypothetical protein
MGALTRFAIHLLWFWSWDYTLLWMAVCGQLVVIMQRIKRDKSRLMNDRLLGKRVLIIGNGPSACTGEPVGRDLVDSFDEVVRFNNGTIKVGSKEEYVGTKTTVHVSDAMLFPTYPEYQVKGAEVLLAQYDERLMSQGSYWFFRLVIDLELSIGWNCLTSPSLAWIPHDEIHALKAELANTTWHQPTSGMLAINHFLKKTDVVYIHGFDFFEGPTIHYFAEEEPIYERFNNHLGVYMHQPRKEKAMVQKLIEQGKVRWLKDKVFDSNGSQNECDMTETISSKCDQTESTESVDSETGSLNEC